MNIEIALAAYGYAFAWIGAAVAIGYLAIQRLHPETGRARSHLQSRYARERLEVRRPDR